MSAKINGKIDWNLDSKDYNEEDLKTFRLVDHSATVVLATLSKLLSLMVELKADDKLQVMQTCCGILFKRASECRQSGSEMIQKPHECEGV